MKLIEIKCDWCDKNICEKDVYYVMNEEYICEDCFVDFYRENRHYAEKNHCCLHYNIDIVFNPLLKER